MTVLCIALFSLALLAGCGEGNPAPQPEVAKPFVQTAPAVAQAVSGKSGTVLETMNAAGYTYVQVDTGKEKFWAAGPRVAVKVGDDVMVPEGAPMANYHSKTLDRTFDMVYFVPSIIVAGAEQPTGDIPADPLSTHKGITVVETTDVDLSGITPAEGGQTIADLFAAKAELAGTPVKVRGKVVKFSPSIMGKNWIHIQDGTGESGTNDLTVTTSAIVNKGDTVVISGTLVIDRDFGYGYSYEVIIEDADVTVE
jgi:hypothetical protein